MPRLTDDGHTVTLDLHGATVDEALDLTYETLYMSEKRGRTSLKLIHGSSTSDGVRRTIKQALHDLLASGSLKAHTTSVLRSQNYLMLSLDLTAPHDPAPIRLLDVTR